jgi:hypothetical protein
MNSAARIYRAEILRAVLGPGANELKADDIARLNTYAMRLADAEMALAALQAQGYGRGAASLTEAVGQVPERRRQTKVAAQGILRRIFRPAPQRKLSEAELHDIWTTR